MFNFFHNKGMCYSPDMFVGMNQMTTCVMNVVD